MAEFMMAHPWMIFWGWIAMCFAIANIGSGGDTAAFILHTAKSKRDDED